MSNFESIFQKLGLKCTAKRLAIMAIIDEADKYLSPEDIWKAMQHKFDAIGLPTIYRNLEDLANAGIISTILHPNRQLYYYYCDNKKHHHHFICTDCRRVIDINVCAIPQIKKALNHMNAEIDSHILQVNGRCETCVA